MVCTLATAWEAPRRQLGPFQAHTYLYFLTGGKILGENMAGENMAGDLWRKILIYNGLGQEFISFKILHSLLEHGQHFHPSVTFAEKARRVAE